MARHTKTCQLRTIHFKTKRGKSVVFRGRTGGQKSHGGICATKPDKPGEKRQQRIFGAAARKCHGRSRRVRNACVRAKLR